MSVDIDTSTLTWEQIVAAIREAYDNGRREMATELRGEIGSYAETLRADALMARLDRISRFHDPHSVRFRDGIGPEDVRYDRATPQTEDGEDPYDHFWWGQMMTREQRDAQRRLVYEALQ